ncbi:hypothetical protein D3C72_1665180 [compost metagenome]
MAVSELTCQLCYAAQHHRIEPTQWRHSADVDEIRFYLGMSADVQRTCTRPSLPIDDGLHRHPLRQSSHEILDRTFIQ